MKWDLEIVADATRGEVTGEAPVTGVVIDSREAGPGDLFVALRGERRDGHEFAPRAAAAGAAVLVERGRLPEGAPGVEVDDPLDALAALGERRRAELAMPVAAVTGSSGKTTTKDLLAAALGPGAYRSPRSFNNEIGVPLTVLGAPDDAEAIVAEIGSRGRGHIARLAPVLRPDVAVITNVGRAHLETFGSVAGVLEAKWELVEALGPAGIAVLPAGDERMLGRRDGPVLTFGEEPSADVVISDVRVGIDGRAACVLTHRGRGVPLHPVSAGLSQPLNLAAAAAAAVALGADFEAAAVRAAAATVSSWRMEVRPGPVTVVNDAYNANPDSTAAALETVAAMPGRHVAVLGRMHELGPEEAALHREVGERARRLGFDVVVVVGEDPGIADGAGHVARRAAGVDEALDLLAGLLEEGDVVLVKASRAEGLEALASRLEGANP